ncbi:hypothetical protein SDC9_211345 [bioreactor metagenome]|uniref:Uncharacterized protein n=1 Tax=bioreactor metagenome TaxID=1076179 RepID=A0A645JIZ4_9ZZZZ
MPHTVNQAGTVCGLTADDFLKIIFQFRLIFPVMSIFHDVVHHHHDPVIGAAVLGALQGTDGRRNGGIDIRACGRKHTRGKGGVVAAAVFRVKNQAKVEQFCFLVGKHTVGANCV